MQLRKEKDELHQCLLKERKDHQEIKKTYLENQKKKTQTIDLNKSTIKKLYNQVDEYGKDKKRNSESLMEIEKENDCLKQ